METTVGVVQCPRRIAPVTVRNAGTTRTAYTIHRDGRTVGAGSLAPGQRTTTRVPVPGKSADISVRAGDYRAGAQVRADCASRKQAGNPPVDRLPRTGPPTDLLARLATGVALLMTGALLWWYGSVWPREGRLRSRWSWAGRPRNP
ncbi:hypothetical protein [Rhizohabitans arisaemae]|uniref:hypothetical protein n=1 Tax=Rhizohabitans arisaemae TaxID=2720610 RepID=UPI0024B16C26|nr:hypothetical protein [Rhizohabitans arisaemae]